MWIGTESRGRSDARAPGRRADVSGMRATTRLARTVPTNKTANTSCVGAGANSTSAPQPSAPIASPLIGATPLTRPARPGELGGVRAAHVAPGVEDGVP